MNKGIIKRDVFLFLLFSGIILFLLYLQDHSVRYGIYAIGICAFIYGVVLLLSYIKDRTRREELKKTEENLSVELGDMPAAESETEAIYQRMIERLYEERLHADENRRRMICENTDYYTMWMHQIKTPISAMNLMLQSEDLPSKRNKMKNELFRIQQYVEMALRYLSITDRESDFVIQRYDLSEIVKDVLKKYSMVFYEKKLGIEFEEFHYQIITDKKWMSFVIEQLISNSVKYTNEGKITLSFDKEHGKELRITDTGIGISSEDLPLVFEKGYTGFNGHMDKRATGIGLYLTKKVVERLGISIRIESVVAQGTTVILSDFSENAIENY